MNTRIVLIGHGYWGKNIARNLHQMGNLYGICEANKEVHKQLIERYPEVQLYEHYDDVLVDANVDGVAISTQAKTHAVLSTQALVAGKDVFVEKPLALTYSDGKRVVEEARVNSRVLMVGHLLEYHPVVQKLSTLVEQGELGHIQYISSNRLNLGKFRREENILWSFAPHDLSVILRLVGEMPIEVSATGGAYLQPNVADTTITNLLFENGARAYIFVSWLHPFKEQRLVVVGSKKMAVFDDRAPAGQKLQVFDKGASWVDDELVPRNGEGVFVPYEDTEPLRAELEHYVHCIETRSDPLTNGANGLRVLRTLQAAQKSLQMGGSRVPLFETNGTLVAL